MEPASIRYKNPGAMWGRTGTRTSDAREVETNAPIPLRWGSTKTFYLSDGKGQGNNIAVFDTWVQGICAQLDLWRTSSHYKNKSFEDAITIWSGHNEVESYIAFVLKRVPGMERSTIMDDTFWNSPKGVAFLKAQAGHEAGKVYPAPDADWIEAQRIVFNTIQPVGENNMTPDVNDPPWLANARQLVGLKEIVGSRHEPKVVEFFAEAGHPEVHDDETAWCAAFANAMLRRAGYAGTGSLAARSFLTWGDELKIPKLGCIVVFKRGDSEWQGHVAFFLRDLGDRIEILGGNQGNAVSVITKSKDDLLGYRWPVIISAPATKPNVTKEAGKAATGSVIGGGLVVGGKAAVDAGWGIMEWSLLCTGLIILCAAAFFGWRWWKSRNAPKPLPAATVSAVVNSARRKPVTPRRVVRKIRGRKKTTKRKAS